MTAVMEAPTVERTRRVRVRWDPKTETVIEEELPEPAEEPEEQSEPEHVGLYL